MQLLNLCVRATQLKLRNFLRIFYKKPLIKYFFNTQIIVLLPALTGSNVSQLQSLDDSDHYIINDLKLEALLDRIFIAGFISRGKNN